MAEGKKTSASAIDRHVDLVVRECQSGQAIVGYLEAEQQRKDAFHRAAREVCKVLGRELGCARPDVHTNMGGPAVAGETYLHTGQMMVQISPLRFAGSPRAWIMFRRTRGDGDWAGGPNAWLAVELLRDISAAAKTIEATAPALGTSIEGNTPFVTEHAHG